MWFLRFTSKQGNMIEISFALAALQLQRGHLLIPFFKAEAAAYPNDTWDWTSPKLVFISPEGL